MLAIPDGVQRGSLLRAVALACFVFVTHGWLILEDRPGVEPTEIPHGKGKRRRAVLDSDVCFFRACRWRWSGPAARSGNGAISTGEPRAFVHYTRKDLAQQQQQQLPPVLLSWCATETKQLGVSVVSP